MTILTGSKLRGIKLLTWLACATADDPLFNSITVGWGASSRVEPLHAPSLTRLPQAAAAAATAAAAAAVEVEVEAEAKVAWAVVVLHQQAGARAWSCWLLGRCTRLLSPTRENFGAG